jgi:Domain of unknown function (DUF4386)
VLTNPQEENDMTITTRTATKRVPMDSLRRTAFVAGGLYLITFVTSIPARLLSGPVRNDPNYVLGPGADAQVLFSGFLDVVLALACIGTAVALYPVVKRQNEGVALGFVGARVLEAAIIVTGVVSLLSVVTLRQAGAGADALVTAQALVASYDWTFLFGPGFMAAVNALLLGSLMYRSGLVPRIIPLVGLIGAPLLLASDTAVMFGLWEQFSLPAGIATLPVALWELSLGVWLVVKGFRPSSLTAGMTATGRRPADQDAAV